MKSIFLRHNFTNLPDFVSITRAESVQVTLSFAQKFCFEKKENLF
jgi:hypothetical protein